MLVFNSQNMEWKFLTLKDLEFYNIRVSQERETSRDLQNLF